MELQKEQTSEPAHDSFLYSRLEEVERTLAVLRAALEKTQAAVEHLEFSNIQQDIPNGRLHSKLHGLVKARTPWQAFKDFLDERGESPADGICNIELAATIGKFTGTTTALANAEVTTSEDHVGMSRNAFESVCSTQVSSPRGVTTAVDNDVSDANLGPIQSRLSACVVRQRRFLRNAWLAVFMEVIIGAGAFAATILQEARTFIWTAAVVTLFWCWLVWIQSLASGCPRSLRTAVICSFLNWVGNNLWIVFVAPEPHYLTRLPQSLIGLVIAFLLLTSLYKICRAMNNRIRQLFRGEQLVEQIVALLGRSLAVAPVIFYQAVAVTTHGFARKEAANNYCSVILGQTCNYTTCAWFFKECEYSKIRAFYQSMSSLENANALSLAKYLHAKAFVENEGGEFRGLNIAAFITTFVIAEAIMSKVRRIGIKTITEDRLMPRERITFGFLGLFAAACLVWINASGGGYEGTTYYEICTCVYLSSLFSSLFCLAWMVKSSQAIPPEELNQRNAQQGDDFQFAAAG